MRKMKKIINMNRKKNSLNILIKGSWLLREIKISKTKKDKNKEKI